MNQIGEMVFAKVINRLLTVDLELFFWQKVKKIKILNLYLYFSSN